MLIPLGRPRVINLSSPTLPVWYLVSRSLVSTTVSLQEDPPGSGGCGSVQRGMGSPGPGGRAHWLSHPPRLPQPQDSPSKGPKAWGMWQQPKLLRPEGNRVGVLFLWFAFCIGVEVTHSVAGGVCVSGEQQHDSIMQSCVHVLFWVLFPYSLLCSVD